MNDYKRCTRCVMDNKSDNTIEFDSNGYCNYCTDGLALLDKAYFPNEDGKYYLNELINRLKKENENKEYDCIMGISGGLDSSYLAYLGAVKWGLRILAVHVDDGYDTEISKNNIKKLCERANIKLVNIKPDPTQFNEILRAYLLAGVPNLAAPQDNVLFASIYKFMRENKIKTFLSGGNYALESILQKSNTHDAYDLKNIHDINRKYGRGKLNKLPLISNMKRDYESKLLKIESPRPLNYIDYNRERAFRELYDFCEFEYYGGKHLENTFTKFVQVYWLVHKYNVDKRPSHLSSMIISNQMTREEALKILDEEIYDKDVMMNDIKHIMNRLDISDDSFQKIMRMPLNNHSNFKTSNYKKVIRLKNQLLSKVRRRVN